MTDEQKAAFIHAMSVSALAEIEAMKAANRLCEIQGRDPDYGEAAFAAVPNKYEIGRKDVLTLFLS